MDWRVRGRRSTMNGILRGWQGSRGIEHPLRWIVSSSLTLTLKLRTLDVGHRRIGQQQYAAILGQRIHSEPGPEARSAQE